MAISWGNFERVLKASNPRLSLRIEGIDLGCMVYFHDPQDPDAYSHEENASKEGLVEVMAIASPKFFQQCPLQDVEYSIGGGETRWVRGYMAFFKRLIKMRNFQGFPLVSRDKVKSLIPEAFRRFNHFAFKNDVMLRNVKEEDEIYKKSKWLKARAKPMPGNGMTGEEKIKRVISAAGSSAERAELFDIYDTPYEERVRREQGMKDYLRKVA